MQRNAEGRIRTTQWEDVQYKHGNKVGKYATHELELLTQRFDDAHPNVSLTTYNPKQQKCQQRYERQHDSRKYVASVNKGECNIFDQDDDQQQHQQQYQYQSQQQQQQQQQDQQSVLASYRSKRLHELRQLHEQQASLGLLRHIDAQNYIDEITNASRRYWVVAILIKPGESKCEALLSILRNVAQCQCSVKFVSIVANEAIPNLPQRVLPCVLLYHNGSPQHQLQGLQPWLDSNKLLCSQHAQQVLQRYKVLPLAKESCIDSCYDDSTQEVNE